MKEYTILRGKQMGKHIGSVFTLFVSFIFLLSISLFLYSCGQNSPTGILGNTNKVVSSNNISRSGLLSMPCIAPNSLVRVTFLDIASEASSPVVILWNEYPQATSYNLYYSDTSDFTNVKVIKNITFPYTFNIEKPEKNYYFILTAIINGDEKRISTEFFSFSKDAERYNIAPSFKFIYNNLLKESSTSFSLNSPPSGYATPVQYPQIPITGALQVAITEHYPINNSIMIFSYTYQQLNGNLYSGLIVAKYVKPQFRIAAHIVEGYVINVPIDSVYPNISTVRSDLNTIVYEISNPKAGFYCFFGGVFDPKLNTYGANTIVASMNGTPFQTANWIPGQNYLGVGDTGVLFDLMGGDTNINITPASATVYLHHTDPEKKRQQFSAVIADNPGTVVTNDAVWSSDNPDSAEVNNNVYKGLAYAAIKPGSAAITATIMRNDGTISASASAELCVDCWEYSTQYRQNDMWPKVLNRTWVDEPYAYHESPYDQTYATDSFVATAPRINGGVIPWSIGDKGCLLSAMSMIFSITGTPVDPRTLDTWLKENNGYDQDNSLLLEQAIYYGNNPSLMAVTPDYYAIPYNEQALLDSFSRCHIIIAFVKGKPNMGFQNGHYVLIVKHEKDKPYFIYDPWYRRGHQEFETENLSDHYNLISYKEIYTPQF